MIGGTELPPVVESFRAFERGARDANPKIRIVSSYIGNWDDVSAGKEQAIAQYSRGVDVIFQNADAAGLGVFQAARERRSVFVIGSNSNQNARRPRGHARKRGDRSSARLSQRWRARSRPERSSRGSSSWGRRATSSRSSSTRRCASRIPAGTLARIDSLQARMLAGNFTISGNPGHSLTAR